MTDRYDHDLLLAYLEDDLATDERAQIEALLADDPQLAALMDGLAGDRALLRSMPGEPAPGDLSFDLVQGLERRMLLDAPQVDRVGGASSGPIPISRGSRSGQPSRGGGARWGRLAGIVGMAAALGLAAGVVIYFNNMADPLTRTAFEMANQPAEGVGDEVPAAEDAQVPDVGAPVADEFAVSPMPRERARSGEAAPRVADLNAGSSDRTNANLAARARDAILGGTQSESPGAASTPTPRSPSAADAAQLAQAGEPAPPVGPRAADTGEPILALTAYAPERALRIASDNPDLSRAQIVNWAVDNGVPVVQSQGQAKAATPEAAAQEPIALLIEEDQLDSLIEVVNRIEVAPVWNQRAEMGAVDNGVYGSAAGLAYLEDAAPGQADVPGAVVEEPDADDAQAPSAQAARAAPGAQAVVALKVPEDLGDDFLNRQNVANTYQFTNQDELALAAQRDAEVLRGRRGAGAPAQAGPATQAQALTSPNARGGDRPAEEAQEVEPADRARAGEASAEGAGPADRAEYLESDTGFADLQDEGDAPREAGDPIAPGRELAPDPIAALNERRASADDAAAGADDQPEQSAADAPPAPARGNWLLPQMPLADSTPIVTDPPTARLVPIVFILQHIRRDPVGPAGSDTPSPDADAARPNDSDHQDPTPQPDAEETDQAPAPSPPPSAPTPAEE